MSKKVAKKGPGKEVVVYDENMLAQYAAKESAMETVGTGNTISIRGQKFSYKGSDLGDQLKVVILGFSFVSAYYDSPYDEDEIKSPACFAVGEDEATMKPHESSPNPQGDDEDGACPNCWANQFKSDARGKGKACKNTRRLAVVAVDDLDGDMDDVEIAMLSVPPTSLAAWKGFFTQTNKALKRPLFSLVTELSFDEDVDYEKLEFKVLDKVPNSKLARLAELRDSVSAQLLAPLNVSNYKAPDERKGGGKKQTAGKQPTAAGKKSKFASR